MASTVGGAQGDASAKDFDGLTVAGAKHRRVDVGEVTLHCVEAGSGPLVLLLHGFPEFWWSWRYQIPALAQAGFHVVAPDLRGYNLSDKPRAVSAYGIEHLTGDVAGLVRAFGRSRAHIVGHDWGGGVAWSFAMGHPEMVERLAVLNCPHPAMMMKGLRTVTQLRKSWYMFFFQLPLLPEWYVSNGDYEYLRRVLRGVHKSDEDVRQYIEAARRGDALHGAINYYRAMMRGVVKGQSSQFQAIDTPTMVVWGENDAFLGKDIATPSPKWVPHVRMEWVPNATHWVQLDVPDKVNALLVDFLRTS
jgi:pimeloyl-ACP methyl ester carboxylesterase